MKVRKIVAGMAAVSMLAAFSAQAVLAADTVKIKADTVEAKAGENFTLNVSLDGVPAQGISVMEFAVKYDPKAVKITGVTAGKIAQNGVDDVEKFDGVTAFAADYSNSGLITITYSTAQTDAKYCISDSGVYAVIAGTVIDGTADGTYDVEIIAIDRETNQGSGTTNKEIKAGYIDADNNPTKYGTAVTNGAVVVGKAQQDTKPTDKPDDGKKAYGDVNCDGKVDIVDVIALNKNLMIGEELSKDGIRNADVDDNGEVTEVDSLNILKYCVKLVTSFPV